MANIPEGHPQEYLRVAERGHAGQGQQPGNINPGRQDYPGTGIEGSASIKPDFIINAFLLHFKS
ncbi:hypothetical protein CFR76_04155 [Komagataeibacter swingsii]|uniref:Uncharacterized protein n=1 Tax=Komagataeibacter swingsii TaxID=215220 RepID=A0A2V4REQ3_9PROT|nr:hypothetical protein CFR76_04155 [Komagataeibacter swingsii]